MSRDEIIRARKTYAARDKVMPIGDWQRNIYHPRHPLGKAFHEHNRSILVQALNDLNIDLRGMKILDVGCGIGFWLRYCVELGSDPSDLTGVDISEDRIKEAQRRNPAITWRTIDNGDLAFPTQAFDIVIQTVVFSSIHDASLRTQLATGMWQSLREGGYLIWLDHRGSSADYLVGFSTAQVKEFFARGELLYERRVHPGYIRYMYRRFDWLARLLSEFLSWTCESNFLIFRKLDGAKCDD